MRKGRNHRCAGPGGPDVVANSRSRRVTALLAAASLTGALAVTNTQTALAQQPPQQPQQAQGKGPVGWDAYRNLNALGGLQQRSSSHEFSSYDRTGGNDDGFNGTYSCLRTDPEGCVIAERQGAGEISSMWFTRDRGHVQATGNIRIELDGHTVLDAPLQDVVDGKLGPPFVWPLVGNGADTEGGSVIKVPMPYRQSMKVTVENNPHFYHVNYRDFSDAQGVQTFDPNDPATDVIEKLRRFGLDDPKRSSGTSDQRQTKTVDLAPGQSRSVAQLSGPARISQLRVRLPQVTASPQVIDDGRAFGPGGGSSFNARVAPNNEGVRIIKRSDPSVSDQHSRLTVDGQPAGEWTTGPAADHQWAVQSVELPAGRTGDQSTIRVANSFVSSSKDVNEFRYDVQSKVNGQWVRTDVMDLGPGHPGAEQAHDYSISSPTWDGKRNSRYPGDQRQVDQSKAVLADARLRISFDGKTTVDAPIGEFFGSGMGAFDVRSLMSSMDVGQDGAYTSWWPMPFGQNAKVELVNGSGVPIRGAQVEVDSEHQPGVGEALRNGSIGYFNATHRQSRPAKGQDYTFLNTGGAGVVQGVTHSMRGLIPPNQVQQQHIDMPLSRPNGSDVSQQNYLEGDERFYVDGQRDPSWHGTGTEDFYESGWYFRDGTTFAMPQAGSPSHERGVDGCKYDCTGAYRTLINDSVPFRNGIRMGIEHGPVNDEPVIYGSTTYWYGRR